VGAAKTSRVHQIPNTIPLYKIQEEQKMKLLTKELLATFAKIGSQDGRGPDATVVCKFFHPMSSYTLFATEYDGLTRTFFGWVELHTGEWGYSSLDELQNLRVRGLGIERDLYFKPKTLREALKEQNKEYPY
jgi:hypothetical protein